MIETIETHRRDLRGGSCIEIRIRYDDFEGGPTQIRYRDILGEEHEMLFHPDDLTALHEMLNRKFARSPHDA
ncbi:hypothetical protein [Streptomyces luteireticuli]|uniref:Transcriptional regulator n=1 Tax=Streptomyces luteireticuli TaxID=173858 RepID=A0ABN0YS29_9ACTN